MGARQDVLVVMWTADLKDRSGLESPPANDQGDLFGPLAEDLKLVQELLALRRARRIAEDPVHLVAGFFQPPNVCHTFFLPVRGIDRCRGMSGHDARPLSW
jgi:hypothetical protein